MKIQILLLLVLTVSVSNAQTVDWAHSLGATSGGEFGRVIKQDAAGNTFIGGRLFTLADFDLTSNSYFLAPTNYHSGYIAKYDANMQLLWARAIGGPEYQTVLDLVVDDNGNVLVTGSFKQSIALDASTTLQSVGSYDIFLAKYDATGQLLWAHGFGSPNQDRGNAIHIDVSGDIYLAGYHSGVIDIDPGSGVTYLFNAGSIDGFVAKFTPQGNFIRRLYIGGMGGEEVNGIDTDASGNVYLTGMFHDGADFIVGSQNHILNTSNIDIFIAKYDSTLQLDWAYDVGGGTQYGSNCQAHDIVVESTGEFAIAGIFWGTAQFDPLGGNAWTTPNAGDIFIARYDQDANFEWVRHAGGSQGATAYDLDTDDAGNYYAAGSFYDSLDFDPGPGVDMRTTNGWRDPCVWSLDAAGNYRWTLAFGSVGQEDAFGIHVPNDSTFLVTGNVDGVADFNPNGMPYSVGANGVSDIFIAKYAMSASGPNSIDDVNTSELSVYPNPANDAILVSFPIAIRGNVSIRLFDVSGRLCYNEVVPSSQAVRITRHGLSSGIYTLQVVSSENKAWVERVVFE